MQQKQDFCIQQSITFKRHIDQAKSHNMTTCIIDKALISDYATDINYQGFQYYQDLNNAKGTSAPLYQSIRQTQESAKTQLLLQSDSDRQNHMKFYEKMLQNSINIGSKQRYLLDKYQSNRINSFIEEQKFQLEGQTSRKQQFLKLLKSKSYLKNNKSYENKSMIRQLPILKKRTDLRHFKGHVSKIYINDLQFQQIIPAQNSFYNRKIIESRQKRKKSIICKKYQNNNLTHDKPKNQNLNKFQYISVKQLIHKNSQKRNRPPLKMQKILCSFITDKLTPQNNHSSIIRTKSQQIRLPLSQSRYHSVSPLSIKKQQGIISALNNTNGKQKIISILKKMRRLKQKQLNESTRKIKSSSQKKFQEKSNQKSSIFVDKLTLQRYKILKNGAKMRITSTKNTRIPTNNSRLFTLDIKKVQNKRKSLSASIKQKISSSQGSLHSQGQKCLPL